MDGGSSGKRAAEARREGESRVKRLNVNMEVDTLDCLICYEPLSPPIFQCSVGHFICSSCRHKQLDKKCPSCSVKTSFKRCFGVEHIVQAVMVPCSNANYGCIEKVTYYQKEEHEKVCPNAPCFCPESSCGFAGSTTTLLDHLTMHHKYRPITLTYSNHCLFAYDRAYMCCSAARRAIFSCSTWYLSPLGMPSHLSVSNLPLCYLASNVIWNITALESAIVKVQVAI